jgi:putative flippase GtrA
MGGKEKNFLREIVSFNIVGAINTAITYGIYSLLVAVGVDYRLALVLEYCFGIVFSFVFNRRYTFRHGGPVTSRMITSMVGSYAAVMGLNFVLLSLFVEILGLNEYTGQFFALGISVGVSFFAQKYLVFKKPEI